MVDHEIQRKIKDLFQEKLKKEFRVKDIQRLGGLTNLNYYVELEDSTYVVRIPGVGTEGLINRQEEYYATAAACELEIDSELIYFDPVSGIKISRYIDAAQTMNSEVIKSQENLEAVAGIFSCLHNSGKHIPVIFNVFDKIREYEELINATGSHDFYWRDYEEVKAKVVSLQEEYESYQVRRTICHNDPLCENFVKGKERMYLVDWEYAGMNDPLWDVADIFIEANFTLEEEQSFKDFYFKRESTSEEERRIMMNKVFLDFLWSLWGLQRYSCGEELQEYANERYIRAKLNVQKLHANRKEGE